MTSGFLQLESTIHILLLSSGPVGDSQICHSKKNNDKLVKICLNIYFLQATYNETIFCSEQVTPSYKMTSSIKNCLSETTFTKQLQHKNITFLNGDIKHKVIGSNNVNKISTLVTSTTLWKKSK
jgi:hypothetical protein